MAHHIMVGRLLGWKGAAVKRIGRGGFFPNINSRFGKFQKDLITIQIVCGTNPDEDMLEETDWRK